ncbi:hypothetical protein AQUSIP_03930 [Aquicella siphonis]|uniref:Uncharacterized protein n=1 Tax=Aquicella siphonis TaxID=254247 RepID=A0A5E4PFC0_9COXI|nr:hypothetical protein [Aquicella siphonis]VVC75117.1 hypothetical protein AQUSIP_03930 [Aquicella siphonis]
MMSGKCGCNKLCPFSFGLAVGLTFGLGVFFWSLWAMYMGASPMMVEYHIPVPTLKDGTIHALWGLLKGFIFGFFIALFYDFISCCCKMKWCCKKSGCACCASEDKAGEKK